MNLALEIIDRRGEAEFAAAETEPSGEIGRDFRAHVARIRRVRALRQNAAGEVALTVESR